MPRSGLRERKPRRSLPVSQFHSLMSNRQASERLFEMALHEKNSIRDELEDDVYASVDLSVSMPKYKFPPS